MIIETIKLHEMGLIPELFLGIGIIYMILHGVFVSFNGANKYPLIQSSVTFLGILILIMICFLFYNNGLNNLNFISFCNTISNDFLGLSSKMVITFSAIGCLIVIRQYLITQRINAFEYIVILLFSILGLFLLCSSNDLMTAYLAIELQSLSFYLLAAFKKTSTYSIESGLKYFILGAFSSGLFLFGTSLIYGLCGSVNFEDLKDLLIFEGSFEHNMSSTTIQVSELQVINQLVCIELVFVGLSFIFISLFFKLALAPFHLWSPDIYEGSPSSSTFFFTVIPKISIFVLLFRLSNYALSSFVNLWDNYIVIVAVGSVIVGSVAGLEQRKLKMLLAYSSIGHMGYLLISVSSGTSEGLQMLVSYIFVYMGSGLCIWSVFILTRLKTVYVKKQNKDLGDLTLLRKSNSSLAFILIIALFSLAGFPPMVGFLVKLSIFSVAIDQSLYVVALIAILFSVISTFYYLRIVKILYFEPVLVGRLYYPIKGYTSIVAVVMAYLFIYLFINPSMLFLLSYKISFLFV